MTCEVVVANRMAVALAADSAVTFADIGNDGSRKETYSWGASKIFQLSQLAPVGIMFYDAADMQGVPWELITKTFSAWLGRDTKRTLSDYVAAFASFVEANNLLFPREDRLTLFRSAATGSLLRVLEEVRYACTTEHTGWGGGNDAAAIAAAFRAICDAWAEKPLPRRCSAAQVQAAVEEHSTWLSDACIELIQHDESLLQVVDAIPLKALSEVVIRNIYVDAHNAFKQRYTGIVFTGFGDDEPYPSIREFRCYVDLPPCFRTRHHTKIDDSALRLNSRGERYFNALCGCFSL